MSAVAQRWGFVNPAHFSRAFRAAYGVSPREWRNLRTAQDDTGKSLTGTQAPSSTVGGRQMSDRPEADLSLSRG